jgi:diacylglycerol kinase (ATP)
LIGALIKLFDGDAILESVDRDVFLEGAWALVDQRYRREWDRFKMRVIWSTAGFAHVWKTESSLHQWIVLNVASALLAFVLPLTGLERGVLLMGGIMVLAAECMNTAIERVVDDISTEKRDRARQAKDAGSAAVAIMGLAVLAAWICIIFGLVARS